MYTGISLFSGQDGMALAMFDAGIVTRVHVEINAWCRELLALRFPRSKIFEDIHDVGQHNLPTVDIIYGGFPCQPISQAGSRRGTADERWIWPEFARVIRELEPAVVFLENSDKITTPIREKGTKKILEVAPAYQVLASLAEMGFDAEWGTVPASAAGAPHNRPRWWCFAWNISNANRIRQRREARRTKIGQDTPHAQRRAAVQSGERSTEFLEAIASDSLPDSNCQRSPRSNGQSSGYEQKVATIAVNRGDHVPHTNSFAFPTGYPQHRQCGDQAAAGTGSSLCYSQRTGLERAAGTLMEESEKSPEGLELEQIRSSDVPDVGRIVFDGLSSRLERQSRTQLYAAPLGLQPHTFEPSRLTDDAFNWKARVQAIGNSVCVPVVRAFAGGIKLALDEIYSVS